MEEKKRKLSRRRWLEIGIGALLVLLLISWAAVLRATETDREASAARKRKFAVARVVDVQEDDGEAQDWTEGRRIGQQQLEVEILTGEWKGVRLETINYLTIYTNVDAREGTRIIVRLDVDDDGQPYVVSVPNYDRAPVLAGLALVFAALLVVIGRKKGLMALAGLLYTLACIWFIQVPMILRGASPRATLSLTAMAKAVAYVQRRDYVVPKDIQVTFPQVIAHRLLLAPEAGARQITPEQLLDEILHQVPSPKL